ncbi:MAG: putative hydrolase of the superfamily [Fimbriimonadaceae bacterium]|nr:putative hydrolase of the superfamily [Fimbriimonadaceae bacterium]
MSAPLFADVKAVIFDLDDTLCQYWEAARSGLFRTFELEGPPGFTAEEMVQLWAKAFRNFIKEVTHPDWYSLYLKTGESTRTEQMRRTLAEAGIVDEDRAVRLSETYMRERNTRLKLFDDAKEVLDVLKGRYPLGLITNGPADVQRQEIATLNIEDYFEAILIEGEMGEGKPQPAVFRRAEQCIGAKPEHILFVGNSYKHDIQPAVEAGWHTAWIRRATDIPPSAGPGGSAVELKPENGPEPDATITTLKELLPLLVT